MSHHSENRYRRTTFASPLNRRKFSVLTHRGVVMKRIAFALVLAAAASGFANAAAKREGSIGAWDLSSHRYDQSGQFSHCVAMANYQSGISMMIAVDFGMKWRMGFANRSWSLADGATYPVTYWIDRGRSINASAKVSGQDFVIIELVDSQLLFEAFRRGHVLNVQASGETFSFSLKDSSASLSWLMNCVTRNMAAGPSNANPFSTAKNNEGDGRLQIEAAKFTANLLSAAGIPGFEIADVPPPGYQEYHAAFVAPGLVGGVIIANGVPQEAAAQVAAKASKECNGALASAQIPSDGNGVHLRVSCKTATAEGESNYYFVPRGKGGLYMVELSTLPAQSSALTTLPEQQSPAQTIQQFSGKVMDASMTYAK